MKQEPAQKQTIAWFKLADFISRGEKERAVGVYNLLAHTIADQAFAKQLEGDLFLCFNQEQALTSYELAATMYLKQHRLNNAIAIYEQMVLTFPTNETMLSRLVELYQKCHHPTRITLYLDRFINPLVHAHQEYCLCAAIEQLAPYIITSDTFALLQALTTATITHNCNSAHLNSLIQATLAHANTPQKQQFIKQLHTFDTLNDTVRKTIHNALSTGAA